MGCRAEECEGLPDPYGSQEPGILHDRPEAYRAPDALVPCPFTVQLHDPVCTRSYERESRCTLAKRARPPGVPVGREAQASAWSAATARDVRSPKGYAKGTGYAGGSGEAGRPPEPLERRGRDGRVVRSDGKGCTRREARVPLRAPGQGVDLRV